MKLRNIFLSVLFALALCASARAEVRVSPFPETGGLSLMADYEVSVRDADGGTWQTVPTWRCDVNLRRPQPASFAEFDMQGEVVVRVRRTAKAIHKDSVAIRPSSKSIAFDMVDSHTIELRLARPEYLSVEFDGDRQHNLHLFANPLLTETPTPDGAKTINWTGKNAQDVFVKDASLIYFGPGIHRPKDLPGGDIRIPSNCTVYLAPGAVVKARLIVDHAQNVRIIGRGILDHPLRGIEITFSHNVLVDGLTVVNPQHYTVFGGQSDSITIRHLKAFSCKSWTDGIDLMCCSNVKIEDVFLRTSDDCIALYNHRWWYWGGSRHFDVSRATLWADVAHPVNIGSHGDDRSQEGETLEGVRIYDSDIIHAYTNSALNFSCGDKNTIKDVAFDHIRVEGLDSTALIGMRVVYGAKYNRAPGHTITDVKFNDIRFTGDASQLKPSFFEGYDEQHRIGKATLKGIVVNGKPLTKKSLHIGKHVDDINL